MSREAKILTAILVVVVGGLIGLFVLTNQGSDTSQTQVVDEKTLINENTHKEGSGSVQLVEFGDYQCPSCGAAHPYLEKIMEDYEGKVTFHFRNFPLANIHPNALAAANAAEEAAALGKFWQMHDLLYEKQQEWGTLPRDPAIAKFADYATTIGVDPVKIREAATNQTHKEAIDKDRADGTTLAVDSTPTFYVDGRKVEASGEQGLRDAIDSALKAKDKK